MPDEDDRRPLAKLQTMLKLHTGKLQSESSSFTHVVPVLAVVQDRTDDEKLFVAMPPALHPSATSTQASGGAA